MATENTYEPGHYRHRDDDDDGGDDDDDGDDRQCQSESKKDEKVYSVVPGRTQGRADVPYRKGHMVVVLDRDGHYGVGCVRRLDTTLGTIELHYYNARELVRHRRNVRLYRHTSRPFQLQDCKFMPVWWSSVTERESIAPLAHGTYNEPYLSSELLDRVIYGPFQLTVNRRLPDAAVHVLSERMAL